MTDASLHGPSAFLGKAYLDRVKSRKAAEFRFRAIGLGAILIGVVFLGILLWSIVSAGAPAFLQTNIRLDIEFAASEIDPSGTRNRDDIQKADFTALARAALRAKLGDVPNNAAGRRMAHGLLSSGVEVQLRDMVMRDPSLIGKTATVWVLASGDVDSFVKGDIARDTPENRRRVSDRQIQWIDRMSDEGVLAKRFSWNLLLSGASAEPEMAGVGVAALGSLYMMLITLALALPIGVATAIYLEEFAPKNKLTDLIEININNLAAVPSIVFGILGLAVFVNFFGLPRSVPVVGGLVLTLMSMPTIIIATRAALKAVPPSLREAALGLGASKTQAIFHHVLPAAMPGILTGTIIAMAHALGETAPLLMIGMVAFVVDYPASPMEAATALPVQIYMWSHLPERGFVARTSAAIMILLAFLLCMNAVAIWLRKRFEKRW